MPLNLPRIAAALNAYPWTPGTLTRRSDAAARYCAIGALLRYAGIAWDHIACANDFWTRYGTLLEAEYGISDPLTANLIICANDSATSQAEAIERVLRVLTDTPDPTGPLARPAPGTAPRTQPATAGWEDGPDDAGWAALLT